MRKSILIRMAAVIFVVGATGAVAAEETGRAAEEQVIEEVLVTATRRTESLQDVPISISVVSEEDIVGTGTIDIKGLSSMIPNFVFAESPNQGLSFMSVRGIYSRSEPSEIGLDQSVGVYVDGVFHSRQFNANANMGGVERVEVLRGPQGTLFGRNTISGAINITTKKPDTDEFHGNLSVDLGNRNLVHGRGSLNIPLIEDTLAIKLFAESRDQEGYVSNITTGNNDLANQERTSSRFQLRYTPSDRTTVDFSASAYDSESDDYFFEHIDGIASDGRKYTSTNDYENNSKIELFNASVMIEHEFENGYTLTSVTAVLDDELEFGADVEATPNPIVDILAFVAAEQFSQELRIASPADRSYDFVAGLYYDDEDSQNNETILVGPGFPFPPIQNSIFGGGGNSLNRTSWAAFIHANFDLNEQVTLFGGLRYSDETKKQKTHPDTCENFFTCVILGNPALTTITDAPVDITLDEWTWTAGLRYHVHQDLMIYGSVGTGVKSGAFNSTSDPVGDFASNNLVTNPEEVTSYELGIKSSLLANHVNLNFALFYMEYDDLQVRIGCAQCGPGGIPDRSFSNAAKATAKGYEVEIVAFPTESLKLTAGIGSLDSTYDEWVGGVEDPRSGNEFLDVSGNAIALSADWTINASAQHTTELMGGILSSRLDLSYVDERFSDGSFHNDPDDVVPSQTLLSGRVSYRPVEDNWGVSFWVKNLTDDDSKVYAAFGGTFLPAPSNRAQYQQPRTYGVTLDVQF